MPDLSYNISGIVYDIDGSTVLSGVIVKCRNITTGEFLPSSAWATTNSAGEYSIDLYNFPSHYSNADKTQVTAYTSKKSMSFRHTINTVIGFLNQDMILHHGGAYFNTVYIIEILVVNNTSSAASVKIYDRKDDTIIIPIRVSANSSVPIYYGEQGKFIDDGICVIFSDTTVTSSLPSLECTFRVRNHR